LTNGAICTQAPFSHIWNLGVSHIWNLGFFSVYKNGWQFPGAIFSPEDQICPLSSLLSLQGLSCWIFKWEKISEVFQGIPHPELNFTIEEVIPCKWNQNTSSYWEFLQSLLLVWHWTCEYHPQTPSFIIGYYHKWTWKCSPAGILGFIFIGTVLLFLWKY
jgi:hypothetical protein